jgi:hypothetical protein
MAQRAPKGLGDAGRRMWRSLTTGAGLTYRADELVTLEGACRTADLIAELDEVIAREPTMLDGSMGQKVVHPAVQEVRLQRQLLASLLSRLDLPEEGDEIGTSEWDGLSASQRARKAA